MTRIGKRCVAAAASMLLLACLPLAGQSRSNEPRVLLLNSYDSGVRWSTELTAGVRERLVTKFPRATLYVDHLQADPKSAQQAEEDLAQRIRKQHHAHPFNIAIAADDAAYQFMLQRHDELLPAVPVVFCGVSDFSPTVLREHRLMTGVLQLPDLMKPLRTALLRQRNIRRLVVIHDGTPAGMAYRRQVEAVLPGLLRVRPGMRVVFLSGTDLSTPELLERLRLVPLDSLILLTVWYQGAEGSQMSQEDAVARIASVSPVPVYSIAKLASGYDTSRERLQLAYQQGSAAADLVAKILRGVPPAEIPVAVMAEPTRPEEELGWDTSQPPATQAQSPAPVARQRTTVLIATLVVAILFQFGIAVFLFVTIARRRRTQGSLEANRRRLELVVDSLRLGVFEWHIPSGHYEVNTHYADMLGYLPDEVGHNVEDWNRLIHPEDLPAVRSAVEDYLEDRSTLYEARYRMRTKTGDYRCILSRAEVTERDRDGAPVRVLGLHLRMDDLQPEASGDEPLTAGCGSTASSPP